MVKNLLPFILATLLITSCTTAPAVREKQENNLPVQEQKEDYGVKFTKVHVPLKEVKKRNGHIVSTTYYTYAKDKKNPVKIETYDIQGILTALVTNEKIELRTERKSFLDGDNNILRYYVITRNESGKITEQVLFNGTNRLIAVEEFDYDEAGRISEWRVYNSNESLLTYNTYTYTNGKNTKINSYQANCTLAEYFENVYDKNGNLIEESRYDKDANLLSQHRSTFRNGLIYREEFLGENKVLKWYVTYAYSEQYRKVTKTTFSADGREIDQPENFCNLFEK